MGPAWTFWRGVVLPGFDSPDLPEWASVTAACEPLADSPSLRHLCARARETGMIIGAGLIEDGGDGHCYNTYVACMPDGTYHAHRKLHAFEHPVIRSGNQYTVFDTPWGVKAAILICWDNNLVENPRACTLMGADIILAPHQTGGTCSRSPFGMKPVPLILWEERDKHPEAVAFKQETLSLAVPAGTVVQPGQELSLLTRNPLLTLHENRGAGLYHQITAFLDANHVTPQAVHYSNDIRTLIALVAAGAGVALLPGEAGKPGHPFTR